MHVVCSVKIIVEQIGLGDATVGPETISIHPNETNAIEVFAVTCTEWAVLSQPSHHYSFLE